MLKKYLMTILMVAFFSFGKPYPIIASKNDEPTYRYTLSVVAIFKNETFFMKEWIEYHRMVGVEHFMLYNNNSSDEWKRIVAPYVKQGLVEVIDWPYPFIDSKTGAQMQAYHDALTRFMGQSKWVALIDLDEFIFPKTYATVTELLEKHFTSFGAVCINWRNFGTSYKTLAADDSILFSLITSAEIMNEYNITSKSIVRPEAVDIKRSNNMHWYPMNKGYLCADGHACVLACKEKRGNMVYLFGKEPCTAAIQINHYRMGDEWYWHKVKDPRFIVRYGISSERYKETLHQYQAFNTIENGDIGDFIKKYHPEKYEQLWKDGKFKREFYHA